MYKSIQDIQKANKEINNHWFDKSTMRFFNSRVGSKVYGGKYFISSEKSPYITSRKYTIRICVNGEIDTVGGFMAYRTRKAAEKAIKELLKG